MKSEVEIKVSLNFKKQAKPLLKKYRSLQNELEELYDLLKLNPKYGIPLGNDSYKIRLAIKSKSSGKRGGARIITYVEAVVVDIFNNQKNKNIFVMLVTIYDKSDIADISDKELNRVIQDIIKYEL